MPRDSTNPAQFYCFKDALARRIISRPGYSDDPADLADFVLYLAEEVWPSLPATLQTATYATRDSLPNIDNLNLEATSTSFSDTLVSCELCDDLDAVVALLRKTLDDYVAESCAPPPIWSKTRTKECELCEREVPLTYHHLIPREVHAKVLKKKWHPEELLNSVAWLCR